MVGEFFRLIQSLGLWYWILVFNLSNRHWIRIGWPGWDMLCTCPQNDCLVVGLCFKVTNPSHGKKCMLISTGGLTSADPVRLSEWGLRDLPRRNHGWRQYIFWLTFATNGVVKLEIFFLPYSSSTYYFVPGLPLFSILLPSWIDSIVLYQSEPENSERRFVIDKTELNCRFLNAWSKTVVKASSSLARGSILSMCFVLHGIQWLENESSQCITWRTDMKTPNSGLSQLGWIELPGCVR